MGLDAYIYAAPKESVGDLRINLCGSLKEHVYGAPEVIAQINFVAGAREIAYWRKHWPLQEWMHRLYNAKGGGQEQCNIGTGVLLDSDDLFRLEQAVRHGVIEPYDSCNTELEAITKARECLANGEVVFYDSSY